MSNKSDSSKQKNVLDKPIWSLTPKVLKESKKLKKITPYLVSLKKGIDEPDVKNIALTGDYGSGKSTILLTFEEQNPQFNYLNISLASFKDDEREIVHDDYPETHDFDNTDRLIELSILQQIIYQAPPSEIPDSRFQRIVGLSNTDLVWFAIGSVLWLISTAILLKFDGIDKVNPDNWTFKLNDFDLPSFLALPIFLLGIGFFMFRLGRVLSNSKISKVNIKGEVELGKDLSKSILNKHLDEILYFFEQTKYDIVIIQDVDRFKTTQIFTKLREINLLINKSSSIRNQNRKIVFIYAIRDEMFETSERVKFFDYIVPVIPFINPSNAKDQFYNLLKAEKLESELKKEFIDDVVTYIDDIDMRLLTNVFQEFSIYQIQMGSGIHFENLFALILYKNLHPNDFTLLPRRKGNLYHFLNSKKSYVKQLIEEVNKEIKELEFQIQSIESERVNEYEELKNIYISNIYEQTEAIEIQINNEWFRFNHLYQDDNLLVLIEQDSFTYRKLRRNSYDGLYEYAKINGNSDFSSLQNIVNKDFSFLERKEHIENKDNDSIEELKSQLLSKKQFKIEIQSWTLTEIFKKLDIGNYLSKFKYEELMGNLITNGYIDENYNEYITLFHEAKLTLTDKNYIKKIKSGQMSNYDYFLSDPSEVIKEIPHRYFSRKEILNYHILGYSLMWSDEFEDKKNTLIQQLCSVKSGTKEERDIFKFVDGYIQFYTNPNEESKARTSGSIPELVQILSTFTGVLWNPLLSNNTTAQQQIDEYIKLVVQHSEPTDFSNNKENKRFKSYLAENSKVINLFSKQDQAQKLAVLIQLLGIKFSKLIEKNERNVSLYDYIYENCHYVISATNIREILVAYNSELEPNDINLLDKANYTTILKSDCKFLKEYVEKNINMYVESVLLRITENKEESEISILRLLNNSNIKIDNKAKIISKQKAKINNIKDIEDLSISKILMKNEKVSDSWQNIIEIYLKLNEEIDEELIEYLNRESVFTSLKGKKIDDGLISIEDKKLKSFSMSLIKCNKLNEIPYSIYMELLPLAYRRWKNIDISDLDEEKVKFLIINNNLSLTEENLTSIEDSFQGLDNLFLEHNNSEILLSLSKEELTLDNAQVDRLILSESVDDLMKEQLIKKYNRERVTESDTISIALGKITNKFNRDDLTYDELSSVFYKTQIKPSEKVNILNNHFQKLSNSEIQHLLSSISLRHNNIFEPTKRQKFTNTAPLLSLAKKLKEAKLIKNYHLQKDDTLIRFYPTS